MPLKMYPKDEIKIKNTIAVAAGKGGVGKSTVTANLARALKQLGYNVGVLDTDIYGPSIRRMMPENQLPQQKGNVITPALCEGIQMISMAYFRKENEAAAVRAPIANGIVSQFLKNVAWGPLDYLIIDFPPGTGDIQLTLSQQANLTGAIMVTTPQEVALMDVRKAIHLFDQVHVPVIGIVENMSYYCDPNSKEKLYLFGKGGGDRLAQQSGLPLLGSIPVDPLISASGDNGEILRGESATSFLNLAKQMIEQVDVLNRSSKECLQEFELVWKEM